MPGLLDLGVSTSSALARWSAAGGCLAPAAQLSRSTAATADVALLDSPVVGSLLALPGTVSTTQRTELLGAPRGRGADGRDVVVTAAGDTADVRLLERRGDGAGRDPAGAHRAGRRSPGLGARRWSAPVVTVDVGGNAATLPVDGSPLDITSPDNPLLHLERLSLGQATDVVTAADGTRASARATALHVRVDLGVEPFAVPRARGRPVPARGRRDRAVRRDQLRPRQRR